MRFLILLIPILALAGEPALPREMEPLKAEYDRDLAKLKADYDAAVIKRSDAYRVKLTNLQVTLTKAGDLDGALAVRKTVEGLPMFVVPEKPKENPFLPRVAGAYRYRTPSYGGVWVLSANKTIRSEGINGTWEVDDKGKVSILWENGRKEFLYLPENPREKATAEISDGTSGPALKL